MSGLNKVMLIGNLGRDPELKYTAAGKAVCNFNLATNEAWTDKAGTRQERTEWHRIVVWNRAAEACSEHLSKGRSVFLEGKIQTREWEDKDGNKRFTTEVVAQSVQFLGGGRGEQSESSSSGRGSGGGRPPARGGRPQGDPQPDYDIPF